jgi:hypothetical protein
MVEKFPLPLIMGELFLVMNEKLLDLTLTLRRDTGLCEILASTPTQAQSLE